MIDEVKQKRSVPPQLLKKKEIIETVENQQLPDPPAQFQEEKKEINMQGLIRDLVFNRYFHIMEKEARPMSERMVSTGFLPILSV